MAGHWSDSTMSYGSDSDAETLEMAGAVTPPPPPPMPPSQGPPAPAGAPPPKRAPPLPPTWLAPPPLVEVETRAVMLGMPWDVQPGGGPWPEHVPILPLVDADWEDSDALSEDDEDMVSHAGSSVATAADPTDVVLNPFDYIINVLHTWGPDPLHYSPLILRDDNEWDFWAGYPLPTFDPADDGWWEAYLVECGLQRCYLRRFWLDRRTYAFDVVPRTLHQEIDENPHFWLKKGENPPFSPFL